MYLMCKNVKVYSLDTQEVLCHRLLPGAMKAMPCDVTFVNWMKHRYSCGTNTLARKMIGMTFRHGKRSYIDKLTHALSLSDSYWISDGTERFEEVSPYYTEFWKGDKAWNGEAAPTLYCNGALPKQWISPKNLVKYGDLRNEYEAIQLCRLCGIPVHNATLQDNSLVIENITSPEVFLEQADMFGRFDEDNYTVSDIISAFGIAGAKMIVIDAIVGNGDRHLGNFGWLRSTRTGEYLGMAPMYDFDHALDAVGTDDVLTREVIDLPKAYTPFVSDITAKALKSPNEVFRKRASSILSKLMN